MNRVTAALLVLVLGCGCSEPIEPPSPGFNDSVSPVIQVVFPTSFDSYDRDHDGLVEIVLAFSDSGSGIDVGSFDIRFSAAKGIGQPVTDIATITHLDADSVVLEESINAPFAAGRFPIFSSIRDSAGNEGTAILNLELPAAEHHKEIDTGLFGSLFAAGLGYCSDDGLLYMTVVEWLVIVDPVSLDTIQRIPPPDGVPGAHNSYLLQPLCIPGDSIIYIGDWYEMSRFDRVNRVWLPDVPGEYWARGLVRSAADPNIIWAGLGSDMCGRIGRFDRATQTWQGNFPNLVEGCVSRGDVAVLSGDTKLFVGSGTGGLVVADPFAQVIIDSLGDVRPSESLALSANQRSLYVIDRGSRQLVEISTESHLVTRQAQLDCHPQEIGLSNDGTRLWVSSRSACEFNYLIDVESFAVIARVARPGFDAPTGFPRTDRESWFEPYDNYVIVVRDLDLDVYVSRR